jgi:hypothetical protein
MKQIVCLLILVGAGQVLFAQNQSIGIRLGEPIGVTYKNYVTKSTAFEFILGTASHGWSSGYYEKSFRNRDSYQGYRYSSHNVNNVVFFQGRYLMNYPIAVQGVEGKFDWYWGVGAALKLARVNYYYQNEQPPHNSYSDQRTDIDFGPEGIGGVEYKFEDLPITLFVEASLMLELGDRFNLHGLIGTGGRFNF